MNDTVHKKRIYLAGFDVFRPDAPVQGIWLKHLCEQYGFEGVYPLDGGETDPEAIFRTNLHLLESCEIVAANLNRFRGEEPDSGTSFELGYAYARGKRIIGYLEDHRSMRERLGEWDSHGFAVEDFGLPVNLMLACAAEIVQGDLEDCLKRLSESQ